MIYYNYEYKNDSENDKKPAHVHAIVYISGTTWYMLDSSNSKILLKTTNAGVSYSTITTRTYTTRSIYHDMDNGELFFVDSDEVAIGGGDVHVYLVMWKLTISSDSITELGNASQTTHPESGENQSGDDIFKIGSDLYVTRPIYSFDAGYPNTSVLVYKWTTPTTWTLDASWASTTTVRARLNFVTIVGTDAYFFSDDFAIVGQGYSLLKFDSTTPALTRVLVNNDYDQPSTSYCGIIYDGSDNLYYMCVKHSDSVRYMIQYNISGDTETILGQFDVSLMLKRNIDDNDDPPFNRQKGFNIDNRMVYQVPNAQNNFLQYISNLKTIISDGTIIAITSYFLYVQRSDSTIEIYEYIDHSDYLTKVEFVHEIQKASYGTLGVNRDEITIEKGMFMQIIGTFTTDELDRLYKGTYNFGDDDDGNEPNGWTTANGTDCTTTIIASLSGHKKVLKLYDNNNPGIASIKRTFSSAQEFGTYEFWVYVTDNTKENYFYLRSGTTIAIELYVNAGNFKYTDSASASQVIVACANATLYRVRIDFECGAGGHESLAADHFHCYINGTKYADLEFRNAVTNCDNFYLATYSTQTNTFYVDAVGFPTWDANYDVDDNASVEAGETDQVIFEGKVIDFDDERLQKVWLESPAKKELERKPRGSFSGRSDEIMTSLVAAYCNYITIGTLSTGTAMGTITYAGDKTLQTIFNELALFEKWKWKLDPQGRLFFNDCTVDTLVDLSKTDKIWMVKSGMIREPYNYFYLKGAIVSGVQLVKELEEADDLVSQQQFGFNPFEKTYASFNAQGILDTLTSNAKAKLKETPLVVEHWHYDADLGMLAIMETVTFVYDTTNVNVSSDQFLINKVIFKAEQNAGGYTIADELI